ncbi:MAG: bifunctional adenosylcobinamide kinase/adenosylcobinamide-phosphate guanylyltransferase [Chloroflexi bacterium]|nr:bifunctional adenosylcobinamide kinase/adenosylcobinamide-phosphate guanylyltransferase [Chloroflexota bacterium]
MPIPTTDSGGLVLLLGGARSGKSQTAVQWARAVGRDAVTFIATAQALDDEMAARIQRHRAERPAAWETLEAPRDAARAVLRARHDVIVLDCLTLLVANALLDDGPAAARREVQDLLEAVHTRQPRLMLLVSNEVGLGIVPEGRLARAYRDLLGWANQQVRAAARAAFFFVAGGMVPLHPVPPSPWQAFALR